MPRYSVPRYRINRDELARLHAAGVKLADIASQLGVTVGTVERHAKALGLTRWQRATPENLTLWNACLDDGWSFEEIHRTHGVDVSTLRHYFPGRGWTYAEREAHRAAERYLGARLAEAGYAGPNIPRPHDFVHKQRKAA